MGDARAGTNPARGRPFAGILGILLAAIFVAGAAAAVYLYGGRPPCRGHGIDGCIGAVFLLLLAAATTAATGSTTVAAPARLPCW